MNRCLIVLCILACSLYSLAQDFQEELSEAEIEEFKNEIEFNYNLFHQSIVNILDEELTLDQRYNSRFVLSELFATSTSTDEDYLDEEYYKRYKISEYSFKLFDLENVLPVIDKSYKFADSIKVSTNTRDSRPIYSNLATSSRHDKMFRVYKGNVFFLERFTNSTTDEQFDINYREDLKRIGFRLIHDEFDEYELQFEHIQFVRENSRDYSTIFDQVKKSSKLWSKEVEELTVAKVLQDAKDRGYDIEIADANPIPNRQRVIQDSTIIAENETPELRPIKFHEYLVPGLGHSHLQGKFSRNFRKWTYLGTFVTSSGLSLYYWNRGNNQIDMSNQVTLIDDQLMYKRRGDLNHKRAKYLGIASGVVFVSNIINIEVLRKKRNRRAEEAGFGSINLFSDEEYGNAVVGLRLSF